MYFVVGIDWAAPKHAVCELDRAGRRVAAFTVAHAGTVNAAQILAEWGDARAAFDHPDAIAAQAGIIPVTKASGRRRGVSFRWAPTKRLRQAITTFADNSRHANPWAADIYNRVRTSGKDHPHASRILA